MTGSTLRWSGIAVAMTAACGAGPGALNQVPPGSWGGEHVAVVVGAVGAAVELDCAHGEITVPLRLEADGSFSLPGYFVHDVGPTFDPEIRRSAIYYGRSEGLQLTLSFTLTDDGTTGGPFTAFLGAPAQLRRCR